MVFIRRRGVCSITSVLFKVFLSLNQSLLFFKLIFTILSFQKKKKFLYLFIYRLMADLFLKKTLNAKLGPNFVKHELWFLCRSAFVNRITIFDYDFRSIHGANDPDYYASPGYVESIVVEP